ncbi:MAG: serine/threonine protein kinase [Myxococcales bacterium]|nr:serine/threonine protein kinase [Myxococcales bacterium]
MGPLGRQPGEVIAEKFRLERPIGSGGMGAVWRADHLVTRRPVALKFLHPSRHFDPSARARLLREARAAGAVEHPAVVAIHDVVEVDGAPVLVMDWLEGESLRERLDRDRRLAPLAAVTVARVVLSALVVAHARGIVHRDLKPENIFLLHGDPAKTRLLDFGVAKIARTDGLQGLSTETGAVLGTPHYMAPEQAFGEKDVDGRADLWALGVVLYECLCGERPIGGENLGQILRAMTECKVTPLGRVAPGVPRELAELVDGLLVDKSRRPASAALVLESLDAMSADLPDAVAPGDGPAADRKDVSTGAPVTREVTRSRGRPSLRVGGALGLAAFTALLGLAWPRAERPSTLGRALGAGAPRVVVRERSPAEPAPAAVPAPSALGHAARRASRSVAPSASAEPPRRTGSDKLIAEPPF